MKSFFGKFKHQQNEVDATILLLPNYISIGYNNENNLHQKTTWRYKEIQVHYSAANQQTIISNQQQKIVIEGNIRNDIDDFVKYDAQSWFKKSFTATRLKLAAFLGALFALLLALYFILVPYLSEQLARTLSVKQEVQLGDQLFSLIADTSQKDSTKSRILNEYFKAMNIPTEYPIRITVLKDATVNAYAVMGGNIVVYEGLLNQLKNHEELAALLSHEFTHVNKQHTTRSIFRSLGSKVFLSLLLGKMSSVASVILGNANQFTSLSYSRALEKEADLNGLEILSDRKINCNGFVQLMERLKLAGGAGGKISEFLSSHPDIDNRIEYLKKSALFNNGTASSMNVTLEKLFLQLSNSNNDF